MQLPPVPTVPDIPGLLPNQIAQSGDSAPTPDKRVAVAILDFEDTSAEAKFPKLNRALQNMLTTDLSVSHDLQLVERARLDDIRSELKLAESGFLDPATAAKVGKGVGAKAVLTGSFWLRNDEMRIDARLVHVASGKVILAEQITGKPEDFTTLEKSLASKVIAATGVRLSAFENAEILQPHTSNLLAASRYGQALADEDAGDLASAQQNAKAALKLDPEFVLAERQLSRVEKDAMFRLLTDNEKKAEFSGAVGRQLEQHRNQFLKVSESPARDARYFASLLILSAHAGLIGDSDAERRLLFRFWEDFAKSVPPANCITISTDIRKIVFSEGEFFRQTIDSGEYGVSVPMVTIGKPAPDFDPKSDNLNPELRKDYRWPKWSALWPFDEDLRGAYGTLSSLGKLNSDWFDRFIVKYPHDYLKKVSNDIWRYKDEEPQEYARVLRTMFSVCLYYNQMKSMPPDLNKSLRRVQDIIVSQLEDVEPHNQTADYVLEATKALDVIGRVEPDVGKRDRANKLLVRFARQAQLNSGSKTSANSNARGSLTIYENRFEALTIIFLVRSTRYSALGMEKYGIRKSNRSEMADAVLSLQGANQSINVVWSIEDMVGKDQVSRLFSDAVKVNDEIRQKVLQSLTEHDRNRKHEAQAFDQLLESLIGEFDSDCCIVLDAQDDTVKIDRKTIERLQNAGTKPRFIVLASAKNRDLLNLAIASNGAFVALKSKGGLLGGGDVTATFLDLSNAQVRFDE
jgi:TolB-like protein